MFYGTFFLFKRVATLSKTEDIVSDDRITI